MTDPDADVVVARQPRQLCGHCGRIGRDCRIAQQSVGGDEPLQLCVTGHATGGGATRVGMNVAQLGAKRMIDLCGRGDRSTPSTA